MDNHVRVMVTGGSGFIGTAIQNLLKEQGSWNQDQWRFLSSKDGDLRERAVVDKLFEEYRPTKVIHLAAIHGGGLTPSMATNLDLLRNNWMIDENVLRASSENGVERVVSCLTPSVYFKLPAHVHAPQSLPHAPQALAHSPEISLHWGPAQDFGPDFGFGFAKRMIDVQNKAIQEKFGLIYSSVIPCEVYGPHDKFDMERSNVIPRLIHNFSFAKKNDLDLVIKGSGATFRQVMFCKDVAKLLLWALDNWKSVEPINLAGDMIDEVPILYIARLIAKNLGIDKQVILDISEDDEPVKTCVINDKLREVLPQFEFTKIEDGIKETVDWYIANYDIARK